MSRPKSHYPFLILLGAFLVFHLLTLTKYPKVHDDEGFLAILGYLFHKAGLPIIDPYLSYHGYFKDLAVIPLGESLFYGSLALVGHFLGFGLYAMRLQPFFFSFLSVILVYQIGLLLFEERPKAFLAALFLAFSSKFLITAHTIREESMLIASFLTIFWLLLMGFKHQNRRYLFLAAFLSGASVCFQANGILLPFVLCALLIFLRREWEGPFFPLFFGMSAFAFAGGLLFLFLDYLPYRHLFWQFFNSPFLNGFTNRYEAIGNPWKISVEITKSIWMDFWGPRYHRYLFYFILNVLGVLGGIFFKLRAHRILLTTLFLILLMFLFIHTGTFYFAYFVPFFSLLLSSVLIEGERKINAGPRSPFLLNSYKAACLAIVFFWFLHPIATVWSYRNYDYESQASKIGKEIDPNANFLSSNIYFFKLPKGHLYSLYLLRDYDLKALMSELDLSYFVFDEKVDSWIVDPEVANSKFAAANSEFLSKECKVKMKFREYNPDLLHPANDGGEVIVFKCKES